MKPTLLFLAGVITIFTISCKKDTSKAPDKIVGQWRWILTYYDNALSDSNPKKPANTGINELIVFKSDNTWYQTKNNIKIDSGTYSTGHGSYLSGSTNYVYDSVRYFIKGFTANIWDAYEVRHDTLVFGPYLAGSFSSYSVFNGGSKWWVKQ